MNYLIIGNSTAAIGGIEGIRSVDPQGRIHVVSQEPYLAYSRPLISYYLAGKVDDAQMYYRPEGFYEKHGVTLYLGQSVGRFDPDNRLVILKPSGAELRYDRLLIATGGSPNRPRVLADCYENLFNFHCWDDVKKIKAALASDKSSRVAVVGGGLIGLKAVESLQQQSQRVHVIEAGEFLLNSILDRTAGDYLKAYLEKRRVSVYTRSQVKEVHGENRIDQLALHNGEILETDLVILAAGVHPNLGWIGDAPIAIDKGILVNDELAASLKGVYAAGDVAQAQDRLTQTPKVIPILPNAYQQGYTAGMNMAGASQRFSGGLAFNSIPLLGLNIATAGQSNGDGPLVEIMAAQSGQDYRRFVLQENRLIGFILLGDIRRCGIFRHLIEQQADLGTCKQRLLEKDFGLADLKDRPVY